MIINENKKERINRLANRGFTIVELLVVIIIIGILATITAVSYTGITQKANAATLQSDLKNASTILEMDKTIAGTYPTTKEAANGGNGLNPSPGTDLTYTYISNTDNYTLVAGKGETSYFITSEGKIPTEGTLVDATLIIDIEIAIGQIADDKAANGTYPATKEDANGGAGLQPSPGVDITYTYNDPIGGYTLIASKDDTAYSITSEDTRPVASTAPVGGGGGGGGQTSGWKQLSAGLWHVCGISYDDKSYCWGSGGDGELGNGLADNSSLPTATDLTGVLSGKTIKSISANEYYTCAIASDNNAYCWGYGASGNLGNGLEVGSLVPVIVTRDGELSGKTINYLSTGREHVCVVASDSSGYCWGWNDSGDLGRGVDTDAIFSTAGIVVGGRTFKSITAGYYHTCAISSDDKAYCWGTGYNGQLGDGTTIYKNTPVAVDTGGALSGKTIKSITTGFQTDYTCAVASDNKAYCWGDNSSGQFGNGTTTSSSVPVAAANGGVLSGVNIKSIDAGHYTTCAVAADDNAYCWGAESSGNLGDNIDSGNATSLVPIAVYTGGALSGKTIKSISVGKNYSCVLASDDNIYCWGQNNYGQLGNGTTNLTINHQPVLVTAP